MSDDPRDLLSAYLDGELDGAERDAVEAYLDGSGDARAELEALAAVRTTDVLARWGGEEFLLLLPETDLGAATQVLSRIQARIADLRVEAGATKLVLTFSAGLTASRPGEPISGAIERADRAMYAAKAGGRNRVMCEC